MRQHDMPPGSGAGISLFERPPILPFVPAPVSDETLSSWLSRIAEIYCLSPESFLRNLRVPVPERIRTIDVAPSFPLIRELSRQTGIASDFLVRRLTFLSLHHDLFEAIIRAEPLCKSCVSETGPFVLKKAWITPWIFFCERHPPLRLPEEIHHSIDTNVMLHDVRLFSKRLAEAAGLCSSPPFHAVPRNTADCIRLVRGINSAIRLSVYADEHQRPVFRIEDLRAKLACSLSSHIPDSRRNSFVVSAWYAWHILTKPELVLHHHTESRDSWDASNLLGLLFHFLPTDLLRRAWARGINLLRTTSSLNARIHDNELRQARFLQGPHRIDFSRADPRFSPFACPELGTEFSFNNQCSRLRLTERPKNPYSDHWLLGPRAWEALPTVPQWRRPTLADLQPYSAAIEQAKLELTAMGRFPRSAHVLKLAFRCMRDRRQPLATTTKTGYPCEKILDFRNLVLI
jgi:hypothetical protein